MARFPRLDHPHHDAWVRFLSWRTSVMQGDYALGLRNPHQRIIRVGASGPGKRTLGPLSKVEQS